MFSRKPTATVTDVARIAGVSTATVSRALARPHMVSAATRARVNSAIQETGYTVNSAARNLRRDESRTILVVMSDVGNMFFSRMLRGVESRALAHDYNVVVGSTYDDPQREARFADFLRTRQADGAILFNGRMLANDQGRITDWGRPVVIVCDVIPDVKVPAIGINNVEAAGVAVDHLIALGHRRIAYIGGPQRSAVARDRLFGYRRALAGAGLPNDPLFEVEGDFTLGSGRAAARELLRRGVRPTALFCAGDLMAFGAMSVFRDNGLRVPHDLSVVGFDDLELAQAYDPPLTTIHQPRLRMGEDAAESLLSMLSTGQGGWGNLNLPFHLVVRQSTAPPAA